MAEARLDPQRAGMLAAMGIDVYLLRSRTPPASAPAGDLRPSIEAAAAASAAPRLAIVCAQGQRSEARLARLFAQLPRALGADASAIVWCEADAAGTIAAPPFVPAYLALGETMARALGAQLSTVQQQKSVIAVTVAAAQLPGDTVGKRALWQALKPVARVLRGH